MTGEKINSLVGDLVEMAQAFQQRPELERQITQHELEIDRINRDNQALRDSNDILREHITTLESKIAEVTKERDDARSFLLDLAICRRRAMKVVYNACYGGFGLSKAAETRYWEIKGTTPPSNWYNRDVSRDDPVLVQVVEELGANANDSFADLQITDVPSGARWRIDEYDGNESVMTVDDYEWSIAT